MNPKDNIASEQQKASQTLYTKGFLLLCLSHILFGASFSMIIPELPAYLTSLGGEKYIGLIIALFTLTAGFSRPFSGKLSDTIGRVPVMVVGTIVCVFCSLLYPLVTGVVGFLFLRFIHGFSTGFKPTAATAYAADIVPPHRRGEAMGILGVSLNAGTSGAPPFGSFLVNNYSMDTMFFVSSAVALVSVIILYGMKETLQNKQSFSANMLILKKEEIFHPTGLRPALITFCLYFGFGAILTVVPTQCTYLGIENKGAYLGVITASSIASRLIAGRVSDIYGRLIVLRVAIVCVVGSLIFLGYANSPAWLFSASGVLGFSFGISSPAMFAWAIDRADPAQLGRVLATVYIALEAGIGTGALLSAYLYQNDVSNFTFTFWGIAAVTSLGFFYLLTVKGEDKYVET
jgi:MFS family permease